jgi:hypothetical protein
VADKYHLNILPEVPVPVTEHVGVAVPHCELFVADGAAVTGLIVIALVVAVFTQPVVAFVAVTV